MYSAGKGRSGLVLGLGGFSNAQMEAAVRILAAIIRSMNQIEPLTQTTL
jgi:GntR family transcriptional regulator/MocR family aminotransferase